MITIDINCDLGEGGKQDAQIMPLISSCNIACGGHSGTPQTISDTIRLAKKHHVAIGAHPSYPDKKNFGRKRMVLPPAALKAALTTQLTIFSGIIRKQNAYFHHIKAHGALYHEANRDPEVAKILIETLMEIKRGLFIYAPPQSVLRALTKGEPEIRVEGFGDRKYRPDYELVSRKQKNAVITDRKKILKQIINMVKKHKIFIDDVFLEGHFQTICLHSDTPGCLDILRYLNQHLPLNGIEISSK